MWPHRSHILAPLTAKSGRPKKDERTPPFQWAADMQKQKVFDQMKALMAADVLCVHTLITISLSISSLMYLITNLVHASCKKANLLHIIVRSLIVHR